MFLAITPQNAVRCVTCYVPIGEKYSDPFSLIKPLEAVRNKLRTLRGILWVREKREKGGL